MRKLVSYKLLRNRKKKINFFFRKILLISGSLPESSCYFIRRTHPSAHYTRTLFIANLLSASMALRSFVGFLFLASAFVVGVSKECTNIPTQLSSHTVRSQLMTTDNQTWKEEMLSHYHLTPTDETAWLGLLPRKLLNEESPVEQFDWVMLYRSMKGFAGTNEVAAGVDFLRDVSLHDVRLDPDSLFGQAQQTNLEYLLMLDVDRLVWNFRNQAGLSAPGKPYGGWESPKMELRGHFVGHYMSACAQMWASTHNETLYEKMSLVVDVLCDCQKKIGTGYLSAFPSEFFDRFEAIQYVWAPYYTIHKIMAGLLDQYLLVGNAKALEMVVWMAEYFGNRVKKVLQNYSIERHWKSLNEETGGMNDVLYRLYSITNDQKHLVLAHLFDKPCFLGLLAIQADSLSGFHSNTHIPVVVGAQMRYEVTGDPLYKEIGAFFMDIVNSSHSYATGGTSVGEFWYDPKRLANTLSTESEESCTTYNMLKISRNLFRWTKEIAYADYYERALTNGVLSIQRGREPGVMIYMLPQGPGQSKAQGYHGWGTKYDSFWCCYGTGIESFSKLGDSIYFEDRGVTRSLYIIQYVSSSFSWKYGGLMINQKIAPISSSNPYLQVFVTISANESNGQYSTLNMRIPSWTSQDGTAAVLNDQVLPLPDPGNFLSVTKKWTSNDKIEIKFLVHLRTEALKDDRPDYKSIQAILFGPYLLAGLTSGDWDIERNSTSISDWISPIPDSYNSQLISLAQECNNSLFIFSNSNGSLNMDDWPGEGTNSVVHGTFRVFNEDSQDQSFVIPNKDAETTFMLEPFDLPGMVIEHQGPESNLTVSTPSGKDNKFKFVSGLDGKPNTVSIESSSQPGCFISGGVGYSAGIRVQLACQAYSTDVMSFRQAASFLLVTGLRMYHPISFVAKGARRNFVLEPLLSLKDETYTVYFNIQT